MFREEFVAHIRNEGCPFDAALTAGAGTR